ncbi:MAG: hypothetical protein IK000_05270 [Bacteroidaceae bacterium]|nr:hypothetical protein [Bacteroidaceae bacterium]
MKKFTLFASALLVALFASANVIVVETPEDYAAAYGSTVDGDTLMLYSGEYVNQNFPAGKTITVMAPDTCEVFLNGEVRGDGVGDGSGIVFENVIIGNGASYLFNFTPVGNIKVIKMKNTVLENVSRCTFYLGGDAATTSVELVEFDNCVLRNLNTGNWNMSWHTTPIYKWVINESTLYGNDGMECFYNPRGATDKSHEFIFTKNTMYSGCRDANRTICNVSGNFSGEECVVKFTDNIIVCPEGKSAGKLWDIRAGYWDVTVKNNLIIGWQIPSVNEDIMDAVIENNYTLEDLGIASIGGIWADAAGADFTLYKGYTALDGKASDGGVLGDPEWLKEVSGNMYTLTQGVSEGQEDMGSVSGPSGNIPEGTDVTLVATPAYGYKFVKWVNAAGETVSEDATYTFTVSGNTTVYAVFDALTMYTLNITCTNGGNYNLSDNGQDGKYPEGTEVVVSVRTNLITTFTYGYMADMSEFYYGNEFVVVMDKDRDICLEFEQIDYICGWDFTDGNGASGGATQNRPADWLSKDYKDPEYVPQLDLYYTLYPDAPWTSGWWNRTDTYTAAVTWLRCTDKGDGTEFKTPEGAMDSTKYYTNQGFYWQTAVCTKGYVSDISFNFKMKRTYMGHYDYFVQYSYNKLSWETVDTVTTTGGWQDFCDTIPNTANKEMVYIRLIPDVTSGYDANRIFDVYGVYVADIFLVADVDPNSVETIEFPETETGYFDLQGRQVAVPQKGIYIKNGKKVLVK